MHVSVLLRQQANQVFENKRKTQRRATYPGNSFAPKALKLRSCCLCFDSIKSASHSNLGKLTGNDTEGVLIADDKDACKCHS